MHIEVEKEGIRLDQFLQEELAISRSKVQKLIKDEQVLVNDRLVNNSYSVKKGDNIVVDSELNFDITVEAEDIPLDIVYEDDDLLVVNKKSGMVTHPAPGNYSGTLVNALLHKFNLSSDKIRPGIVHRLDKDTSGVMLVAKNDYTHERLSDMIKDRSVKRVYVALVNGVINHETGTIEAPIGRDTTNRQKMMVTDINSKDAITHFRVMHRYSDKTLLECKLETGRTHQIRVHMAYINHPVINDPLYNKKKATDFGQLLHSKRIEFNHPRTGKLMTFETDLPIEFSTYLEELDV